MFKNSNLVSDLYDKLNDMSDRYKNKNFYMPSENFGFENSSGKYLFIAVLFVAGAIATYITKSTPSYSFYAQLGLGFFSGKTLLNALKFYSSIKIDELKSIDKKDSSVKNNLNYLKKIKSDKSIDLDKIINSFSKTPKSILMSMKSKTSEVIDSRLKSLSSFNFSSSMFILCLSGIATFLSSGAPNATLSLITAVSLFAPTLIVNSLSKLKLKTIKSEFIEECDKLIQENQDTPDYEEMVKEFKNKNTNKQDKVKENELTEKNKENDLNVTSNDAVQEQKNDIDIKDQPPQSTSEHKKIKMKF